MNISTLQDAVAQCEEGVEIPILDPLGEPYTAADGSPATMTVLGTQSKAIRKARDQQTQRYMKQAKTDAPDIMAGRIRLATAGVVGWHGFESTPGENLACTPENVSAILGADERVLEQIEIGIQKHAAFLANRKPSS